MVLDEKRAPNLASQAMGATLRENFGRRPQLAYES